MSLFPDMKYGDQLCTLYEILFEPWMDDTDKANLIIETLHALGKTLSDVDKDIEIGIQNGVSVEEQMVLCKNAMIHEQNNKV